MIKLRLHILQPLKSLGRYISKGYDSKYLSVTTQTTGPRTVRAVDTTSGSPCFDNMESSRLDGGKVILKDPGDEFNHFNKLFGGNGSFT